MSDPVGRDPWRALRGDKVLRVVLACLVALHLPYVLPFVSREALSTYADLYMGLLELPLVMAAILVGVGRLEAHRERLFWTLLGGAFALWWLVSGLFVFVPWSLWGPGAELTVDVLYAAFYLVFFIALGLRPDRAADAVDDQLDRLEAAGWTVLVFALVAYFVLIPSAFDRAAYDTWLPSLFLYVTLDLLLASACCAAWWRCDDRRWRVLYAGLGIAAILWAVLDTLECLSYAASLAWQPGELTDFLWLPPFVLIVMLARARHQPFGEDARVIADPIPRRQTGLRIESSLVISALALPAVHLVAELAGLLDTSTRSARDGVTLAALVVLGAIAVVERHLLRRREAMLEIFEEQLRQTQKLEAVGQLASGIAHDVRNFLTVIQWHARLARQGLDKGSAALGDLTKIDRAVDSAETLVGKLLVLARPRESRPLALDLDVALARQVEMLHGFLGAGVEIDLHLRAPQARVRIDPVHLEQSIMNLCLNARDAMPEQGGQIVLSTGGEAPPERLARGSTWHGPWVRLRVQDDGTGMDEETRARVFEPFFTTKESGTGLGLAVVFANVRGDGGLVDLESEPGRGTTFDLYWPAHEAQDATGQAVALP